MKVRRKLAALAAAAAVVAAGLLALPAHAVPEPNSPTGRCPQGYELVSIFELSVNTQTAALVPFALQADAMPSQHGRSDGWVCVKKDLGFGEGTGNTGLGVNILQNYLRPFF